MPTFDPTSFQRVNVDLSQPKHERLRAYFIQAIKEGSLRTGDILPTENELAVASKMSRNTVRQALSHLEQNGFIRRVPGRGTFIHQSAMQRLNSGLDLFALVLPETRTAYYPSLQRGFNEASAELQNQVIICDTDNDLYRQADALLHLMDKKVAGVAIVPITATASSAHQIRVLRDRGIPVVFCHRRVDGIQAPLVTFTGLEVGRIAGKALVEKGHKKVALFGGYLTPLAERFEQGLRETLHAGGGDLPSNYVHYQSNSSPVVEHEGFIQARLEQLLKQPSAPTAIFCTFDSEAEWVYLALNRKGIRIPEEISIVSFGGTFRHGALASRLTSVTVDEEELGRTAAKLLTEMRRGERLLDDVTEIFMPLSLSPGETLGTNKSAVKKGAIVRS